MEDVQCDPDDKLSVSSPKVYISMFQHSAKPLFDLWLFLLRWPHIYHNPLNFRDITVKPVTLFWRVQHRRNTGDFIPYSSRIVCGFFFSLDDYCIFYPLQKAKGKSKPKPKAKAEKAKSKIKKEPEVESEDDVEESEEEEEEMSEGSDSD